MPVVQVTGVGTQAAVQLAVQGRAMSGGLRVAVGVTDGSETCVDGRAASQASRLFGPQKQPERGGR